MTEESNMAVDFARQSYMRCPFCRSVVSAIDTRDDDLYHGHGNDSDLDEYFAAIEEYVCEECDHTWEVGVRWKPDEESHEYLPVYLRKYAADNCFVCGEQMMVKDDSGAAYMYCTAFPECEVAMSLRVFIECSDEHLNIELGYDETKSLPLDEIDWAACLARTISDTSDYQPTSSKNGCLTSIISLFILAVSASSALLMV